MGRRRKREDVWFEIIPQAVGVLFLFSLISPTIRKFISGFGRTFFFAAMTMLVALIVFTVYRAFKNSRDSRSVLSVNGSEKTDTPALQPSQSPISTNLIHPLRTIDWFQFEKLVELLYQK